MTTNITHTTPLWLILRTKTDTIHIEVTDYLDANHYLHHWQQRYWGELPRYQEPPFTEDDGDEQAVKITHPTKPFIAYLTTDEQRQTILRQAKRESL